MRIDNLATVNSGSISENSGQKITPIKELSHPENSAAVKMEQNEPAFQNEEKRLKETVEHANKMLEDSGRYFKYEMHEPSKHVVISVVDNNTNEVITEIPAKKLLDIVTGLMELAGVIVDERR